MAESPSEGSHGRARVPGEFLVAGRVVRPHGVRGELLVEGVSELMAALAPGKMVYLGEDRTPAKVKSARPHSRRYLLRLEGVSTRDHADKLRASEIRIPTTDAQELSPGAYYHWQILGLDVISDEGETLGTVKKIIETGANDVYVVGGQSGKDLLIPAISSVVRSVDLAAGSMTVTLIAGLREAQD